MASKREVMLLDKQFVAGVIDALKSMDVRGYESNKQRTIVTMELERALATPLPLTVEPNGSENKESPKAVKKDDKK